MSFNISNRVKVSYDDEDIMARLYIDAGRKIYREDIEKVIEYLEEKKYDFETK